MGLRFADPADYLDAGGLELGDAAPGNPWIGIAHGDDNAADARGHQGFTAGGRAAVMAAGFQGDDGGAALGPRAGLAQGVDLRVGGAGLAVKALADQGAGAIQNEAAHQRVGARASGPEGGQLQGPLHPGPPGAAAHPASRQLGRLRHSPTTKGGTGSSTNTPGSSRRRGRF